MSSCYIQTVWFGDHWSVRLVRSKWMCGETAIIINHAYSDKERDEIIEKFKLNKDKYLKEYELKESQERRIPL